MTQYTPDQEQQQLRDFINELEELRSKVKNITPPAYLTDEQKEEVRKSLSFYSQDLNQTIDWAGDFDKEEWYEH